MKYLNYFIQCIFVITLFIFFKICGLKLASTIGGKIFEKIGPLFRSKKLIKENIMRAFPDIDDENLNSIISSMWNNYGRVFAEYMFIKKFRNKNENISVEGKEILENIKNNNQKVIFISGHFSNFELMAMEIEKSGINLAAIYRPLNNIFLNFIMERIRKKHICKNQIKKGIGGVKELVRLNKEGYSTALMIDQRVSEGIKCDLFNKEAYTTTIPAQLIKKFNSRVVPLYIERLKDNKFKLKVHQPIKFKEDETPEKITLELNKILENMIKKNPEQWIWTHNRWK